MQSASLTISLHVIDYAFPVKPLNNFVPGLGFTSAQEWDPNNMPVFRRLRKGGSRGFVRIPVLTVQCMLAAYRTASQLQARTQGFFGGSNKPFLQLDRRFVFVFTPRANARS